MKKLDHEKICRMYREGYELDEIMYEVGCHRKDYLKCILAKYGVPIRDRRYIDKGKIRNLYKYHRTPEWIADDLNLPIEEVMKVLEEKV